MARHFYFLLLCFALVTFAHGDCLADQERYNKTFEKMFPVCDEECTKKKRIHEADFAELFPQCKASKDNEIKTPTVNLGTMSSNSEIVKRRHLFAGPLPGQRYNLCSNYNPLILTEGLGLYANCSITSTLVFGSGVSAKLFGETMPGIQDDGKRAIDGGLRTQGQNLADVDKGNRLFLVKGGTLTIDNLILVNGAHENEGGVMRIVNGSVFIKNSIITGNRAEKGCSAISMESDGFNNFSSLPPSSHA